MKRELRAASPTGKKMAESLRLEPVTGRLMRTATGFFVSAVSDQLAVRPRKISVQSGCSRVTPCGMGRQWHG
ncbi:hypothetical protein [Paenibacillus solanacearum]|uniref:hypothetical protein n=1 Tax=Paenibacillus solanacearum TaxID=2048548 RepID=UPI001C403032|nr:hypothetical protein [Paenibacillus solanacearum]